ncbi:hypothetical protein FLP41_10065 [Paracoccus marcusii]|uniref:hypothetical protein n=1 Tax=Paracoccus marcusii TaxID=59779 RepID=UPI002ED12172|nr:hypothetical protein FLP41_10065 [Paracoccus marcusii]
MIIDDLTRIDTSLIFVDGHWTRPGRHPAGRGSVDRRYHRGDRSRHPADVDAAIAAAGAALDGPWGR